MLNRRYLPNLRRVLPALLLSALAAPAGLVAAAPQAPIQSAGQDSTPDLSPALKAKLRAACFEVVVPRPEEKGLTYEKELPWDSLPFRIRNDHYYSIGTAFAVSPTELLTAFHVLDLGTESLSFRQFFIRDSAGKVYEVDRILASDSHRDAVRFTVKGRTFDQWLPLGPAVQEGGTVFTAGNALGDGIVIRRGDVLGTTPEPMEGAWSLIKSSAEVNPGNSGGPLVDAQGRAVGIVLQKNDNICYSLPAKEIQAMKQDAAVFHTKMNYAFRLFPEQLTGVVRDLELPLPKPYQELRDQVHARMEEIYTRNMDKLFQEQSAQLFPLGDSSHGAIQDIPTSDVPEVVFKDETTRKWSYSGLKYSSNDLDHNGQVAYAEAADLLFVDLTRPEGLKLKDLYDNPKLRMDLFLKGVNIPREMAGQKIRITSFGDPIQRRKVTDRFGRRWDLDIWHLSYSDEAVIVYTTAVPCGADMLIKICSTGDMDEWTYDLTKILDYTYVPYFGKLRDWPEYLELKDRLPQPLADARIAFQPGKSLDFHAAWFDAHLGAEAMSLEPTQFLALNFGFAPSGAGASWALRRISMGGGDGGRYFVLLRHFKPYPDQPEDDQKTWKETVAAKHPYTRVPFQEDGRTNIAGVLKSGPQEIFTLYEGRDGALPEPEMKSGFEALASSLTIDAR